MSDAFGRRLRAYRKLKHWSQAALAERVGVSVAIIGGLERGTRSPTKEILTQLMLVLNVSEQELCKADESSKGISLAEASQLAVRQEDEDSLT